MKKLLLSAGLLASPFMSHHTTQCAATKIITFSEDSFSEIGKAQYPDPTSNDIAQRGDFVMKVGETLMVRVPEIQGTGYGWSEPNYEQSAFKLVSNEYAGHQGPGAAGYREFVFEAKNPSDGVEISSDYLRSWEEGKEPAKSFVINIARVTPKVGIIDLREVEKQKRKDLRTGALASMPKAPARGTRGGR